MGAQPNRERVVPIWTRREKETVMQHMSMTESRLKALEDVATDVTDIAKNVTKIWRAVKVGLPTIVGTLVGAGYMSGDIGKIITTIFGSG